MNKGRSMTLEVKEVTTLRALRRFVAFPYALYGGNRYWVPPVRTDELASLRREKNPAFDFCDAKYWLAYRDGRIVGRIAGIINSRYNEKWHRHAARFGWFDFIDDEEVCRSLLERAEGWAVEQGMCQLQGPLGFTDMDGEGVLVEGFEETSTLGALYNYPYYPRHIEKAGYAKDTDWVEYEVTMHGVTPEKVSRLAAIALQRNNLRVLKITKSREILPYAKQMFHLLNTAYKDLYGFVELSERQIDMYVKQYFGYILPEYVPVVLNASNDVVAFGIMMPSLSEALQRCKGRLFPFGFLRVLKALKHNNRVDLYLTAVRPDMQNKGVNAILIRESNEAFNKNGIVKVETNRELEGNAKIRAQWKLYDTRLHKRRRCYTKQVRDDLDNGPDSSHTSS